MTSRSHLFLAALFALLMGAAGGFFAGRDSVEYPGPRSHNIEIGAATESDDAEVKPSRKSEEPQPKSENANKAAEPERPAPETPSLKDAIEAVKVDAPARGTGKITGTVRKQDGSPLAGVSVTARLQETRRGASKKTDPTIEEEIAEAIKRRRYRDATDAKAKTEADGTYTLEGIRDDSYYVFAQLDGYQINPSDWRAQNNVRPGGVVDFVAKPVGKATVDVLFADGRRPDKAYIAWVQRGTGNGSRYNTGQNWTPENRECEHPFGTYEVTAYSGDKQEFKSESATVQIEPNAPAPAITLTLKERNGIKGKLLLPKGDSGNDLWVNAMSYETDPPDEAKFTKHGGRTHYYSTSDGMGIYDSDYGAQGKEYAFLDLKPGKYLLGAVRGGKIVASANITVGTGLIIHDLPIPELSSDQVVIVHVVGPDGKPLNEVTVSSGCRHGQYVYGGAQGNKKGDGLWWVAHAPQPQGVENPSYVVLVYSGVYGNTELAYDKKPGAEITVKFADPASLVVTVTGLEGHPFSDKLYVVLAKPDDPNNSWSDEKRGEKREWTFGPVPPGRYEVRLMARGEQEYWGMSAIAKEPVTLVSGKNTATIAAPKLYKVKVTVKNVREDSYLGMSPEGEQNNYSYAQVDAKGVVEFGPLAPGRYRITNWNDGTFMLVNVPEQLEVNFVPSQVNAFKVEIKDSNLYAATLGLQTGDLIVGVNGVEFENQKQMYRALEDIEDKENAKFMVVRGGGRLEITADYHKLFDQNRSGAILTADAKQ